MFHVKQAQSPTATPSSMPWDTVAPLPSGSSNAGLRQLSAAAARLLPAARHTRTMVSPALKTLLHDAKAQHLLGATVTVEAHLTNGAAFADVLRTHQSQRIVDLGSGAGVPALIIAELLPDTTIWLIERSANRVGWLQSAITTLALADRCEVVAAAAEDAARTPGRAGWADAVTARSFAPPATTAECACRFLRPDGVLVVSEPPADAQAPPRWPLDGLAPTGLEPVRRETFADTTLQTLQRRGPIDPRLPRREAVTRKRPLFA